MNGASPIQKSRYPIHYSPSSLENEGFIGKPHKMDVETRSTKFKVELKSISWLWEVSLRVGLGLLIYYFSEVRKPFQRWVEVNDWPNYNYPHKDSSTIPYSNVVLFAVFGPTILVSLVSLFNLCRTDKAERRWRKKYPRNSNPDQSNWVSRIFVEYVIALLAASMAYILVQLITDIIKTEYGGLRPDFLSRCFSTDTSEGDWLTLPGSKRNNSFDAALIEKNMPYIETVPPLVSSSDGCSNSGDGFHELIDKGGRKSFPSGHTSTAFSASTFCALYSFYWLRRWGSSLQLSFGEKIVPSPGASVGAAFLFCWFLPGIYVAVSRTQDYRHHPRDVIVGAVIGIFITTVVFCQYYSFRPNKLRKTYPRIDIDSRHISSSNF